MKERICGQVTTNWTLTIFGCLPIVMGTVGMMTINSCLSLVGENVPRVFPILLLRIGSQILRYVDKQGINTTEELNVSTGMAEIVSSVVCLLTQGMQTTP